MGKVNPGWEAAENQIHAAAPYAEIDVRRRSDGNHKGDAFHANSTRITHESVSGGRFEPGDMMRGVTRRIKNLKAASAERNILAAFQRDNVFAGHWKKFAEAGFHAGIVKAASAGEKLRRIRHVASAQFVDVNTQARIFAQERAGSAGMIQVDVSEKERIQVRDRDAPALKLAAKHGEGNRRAGVNESQLAIAFEEATGDGARMAEIFDVDSCGNRHGFAGAARAHPDGTRLQGEKKVAKSSSGVVGYFEFQDR